MQRNHGTGRQIEPAEGQGYTDLELPETIARQAQALVGADEPPRTLGEQSRLFARTKAFQAEEEGDVEKMLVTDDSRHAVHVGGDTINTHCFLDALGIGLLQEGSVKVTTRPPGMDETIELTVASECVCGTSPEMVVAYGFSTGMPTDSDELAELTPEETLATMHEHGCPTQNLFPDRDAYEAWARQTDAATMPMSLPQALAMVHDYVQGWTLEDEAAGPGAIDIHPGDGDDYAERELPEEIGQRLRVLTGLAGVERAPRTFGDFAELNGNAEAFSPDEVGIEAMLLADDSRHEVRWGDRQAHTNCILDALILGFLTDGPVEIATRPPGADGVIELTASEHGIEGADEDMVVSFGFSTQLPSDPAAFERMDREEVLALAHEHGCPKINLFPDREAYEAWAEEAEAVTMPIGLPQALALARDTVEQWPVGARIAPEADDGTS